MSEKKVPVFQVSQILDKTTLLITGDKVGDLSMGSVLLILAVTKSRSLKGIPLVLPKVTLEVTLVTDFYAVARPPVEKHVSSSTMMTLTTSTTISRRPKLDVEESNLVGNPASIPIAIGDPVIEKVNLRDYVAELAAKSGIIKAE